MSVSFTPNLTPEQRRHLVGISEHALQWLTIYGVNDNDLAMGIFNTASLCGYWPELTMTPRWTELKIWRLQRHQALFQGQLVNLHPSMVPGGNDHAGPPDYVHREDFVEDAYGGTRLAAHAMLWILQDGKPAADEGPGSDERAGGSSS